MPNPASLLMLFLMSKFVSALALDLRWWTLANGFNWDHASSNEVEPEVDLSASLGHRVLAAHHHQVDSIRVAEELVVRHVVRFHAREIPDTNVTSR